MEYCGPPILVDGRVNDSALENSRIASETVKESDWGTGGMYEISM
jgi:hypothetical protein